MVDFKYEIGAKIFIAFVMAVLVVSVLSPFVSAYAILSNLFFTCTSGGIFCSITSVIITFAVPVFAVFFGVMLVFEVFLK